jgi:hypothetical protein
MNTQNSSLDPTVRYVKNHIDKEVWLKAKSLAALENKPITVWVEEAMKQRIKRESK